MVQGEKNELNIKGQKLENIIRYVFKNYTANHEAVKDIEFFKHYSEMKCFIWVPLMTSTNLSILRHNLQKNISNLFLKYKIIIAWKLQAFLAL